MRKILSAFLILTMTLSFCACNTVDPLELEGYSELDNDDLRIVASYRNSINDIFVEPLPKQTYSLEEQINMINNKDYTFYETEIDSKYYICGYINHILGPALYLFGGVESDDVQWYRVSSKEQIKDNIKGMGLTAIYLVYDATIKKDVINATETNKGSKISFLLDNKDYIDDQILKIDADNKILMFKENDIADTDKTVLLYSSDIRNSHRIHTDGEGNKLVVLHHSSSFSYRHDYEPISIQLGKYYEQFLPCFIFSDELNEKRYIDESGNYIDGYQDIDESRYEIRINVGISMDDFVDLILK